MGKLIGLVLVLVSANLFAEEQNDGGKNCLSLARISRTQVIDSQTIHFYQGRKTVYENKLPRRCAGLGFHKAFSYKTSIRQLCKQDSIRVVQQGSGMGSVCMLGKFRKLEVAASDE